MDVGDSLGRFHILSRIAHGGMAEVWLARMKGLGGFEKDVVVKTILPHLSEDPGFVKMFVNEALLAAKLNHPSIVQIFDLGYLDGQYFIAMEYVQGRTLRQIARHLRQTDERLPLWFTLRVVQAVCDGLQYAHHLCDEDGRPLNLVHRDISPENIMIAFTGSVKILDFGIAIAASRASLGTGVGTLKGKYSYISPEQVKGFRADKRSDIYSLGVVLYEFLSGQRPHTADSDLALLRHVLEERPRPIREIAPWVPSEIEAVVMKAIAVNPADRYSEAEKLGDDLGEYLQSISDMRGRREMGLYLASLFPFEPDVPEYVIKGLSISSWAPESLGEGDVPELEIVQGDLATAKLHEVTEAPGDPWQQSGLSVDQPTLRTTRLPPSAGQAASPPSGLAAKAGAPAAPPPIPPVPARRAAPWPARPSLPTSAASRASASPRPQPPKSIAPLTGPPTPPLASPPRAVAPLTGPPARPVSAQPLEGGALSPGPPVPSTCSASPTTAASAAKQDRGPSSSEPTSAEADEPPCEALARASAEIARAYADMLSRVSASKLASKLRSNLPAGEPPSTPNDGEHDRRTAHSEGKPLEDASLPSGYSAPTPIPSPAPERPSIPPGLLSAVANAPGVHSGLIADLEGNLLEQHGDADDGSGFAGALGTLVRSLSRVGDALGFSPLRTLTVHSPRRNAVAAVQSRLVVVAMMDPTRAIRTVECALGSLLQGLSGAAAPEGSAKS